MQTVVTLVAFLFLLSVVAELRLVRILTRQWFALKNVNEKERNLQKFQIYVRAVKVSVDALKLEIKIHIR